MSSLFNRPAWAAAPTADKQSESDTNIFSHTGRAFPDIVAEQARQRKAKREKEERKRKAAAERRLSNTTTRETDDAAPAESGLKRRRITLEDGDELLKSAGFAPADVPAAAETDDLYADDGPRVTDAWTSPRSGRSGGRDVPQAIPANNDVSAFAPVSQDASGRNRAAPIALEGDGEDESDDEFAELARRARTNAWPDKNSAAVDGQGQLLPDAPVELLITSPIPNTTPLIVRRLLSQRLQEVREAFCHKQKFDPEFAKDVFFVHRMHKLYDVTTCRSLGLEVDVFGHMTMRGDEGGEGVDKVHLEAVTDDIFKQMRENRTRKPEMRQHFPATDNAEDRAEGADDARGSPKKEQLIGLVFKAKSLEDYRLRVRPTTRISKAMAAYVKARAPGREIVLEFDGERLNPDDEVQNTELDDMDCVDVHFIT